MFILDLHLLFNHLFRFSFFKLSDKIYKSVRTLDFFTSHSWIFPNDNSRLLQNEMSDVDQRVKLPSYAFIPFSIDEFRFLIMMSKIWIGFNTGETIVWVQNSIFFEKISPSCRNVNNEIKGNISSHSSIILHSSFPSRLKRMQNLLWFSAIALIIKYLFFRSFPIRRMIFSILRSILSVLSSLPRQIRLIRK